MGVPGLGLSAKQLRESGSAGGSAGARRGTPRLSSGGDGSSCCIPGSAHAKPTFRFGGRGPKYAERAVVAGNIQVASAARARVGPRTANRLIGRLMSGWVDTVWQGHFGPGQHFPPYVASERDVGPLRYCIRTCGGLELLAAEEVEQVEGCTDARPLLGKVIFASTAPLAALRSAVPMAEELSLLCWAIPTPPMPGEPTDEPVAPAAGAKGAAGEATLAPKPEYAPAFAAFYEALEPVAATWFRALEALLRTHALPAIQAREAEWRRMCGHAPAHQIAFRASVRRGGARSSSVGATSQLMEQLLGGLCCDAFGWRVDLRSPDLDLNLHWNEAQVVVEMPITRRLGERPYLVGGALHGPIGWALARLARIPPTAPLTILDPCAGVGGLLIEAALAHPRCTCVGFDRDARSVGAAIESARKAGVAERLALAQADCTSLPLPASSVDVTLVDLPFGKRHTSSMGLNQLYALTVAELARVSRTGGALVALSTHKNMLSRAICDDGRWEPLSRTPLSFGGLRAFALVARRRSS